MKRILRNKNKRTFVNKIKVLLLKKSARVIVVILLFLLSLLVITGIVFKIGSIISNLYKDYRVKEYNLLLTSDAIKCLTNDTIITDFTVTPLEESYIIDNKTKKVYNKWLCIKVTLK